jgi:hypothetical protein
MTVDEARRQDLLALLDDQMKRKVVLKAGADLTPTPQEFYEDLIAAGYPAEEAAYLASAGSRAKPRRRR